MANEQFESLIEAMPRIAEAVNAFESDPLRERAMDSLLAAFGLAKTPVAPPTPPARDGQESPTESEGSSGGNGGQRRSGRKASRRSDVSLTLDKSLSARPEGKDPLKDFLARAQPTNQNEQILAIVYWLDKVAEVSPVTHDKIYTCFRLADLKVPGSFSAKVSQTGSKTWLGNSLRDNVTLSVAGEDYVLHTMLKRPPKAAKGE